ncbi:hypothetical protein EHV15_34110 [Paenibacillus oralis]|uniref:Uncharacterized protein n=1 Tax=Paenibacillus oralis TaxID=2490856 RepID=A0A3P3TDW1_9BACL|nr:hypothetical protein [Paenibacillus oralis]RRJ54633.1 hypothetical protein EHV15_34110 [Paenibacillus oralis]
MQFFYQQMLCQTCPDKRRVQQALDEAKRITNRLREMMDDKSRMLHTQNVRATLFHTPIQCSASENSCNEFSQYENDLRLAVRELEATFLAFQEELQGLEEKKALARKGRAFDLLRGYYPKAACLMRR